MRVGKKRKVRLAAGILMRNIIMAKTTTGNNAIIPAMPPIILEIEISKRMYWLLISDYWQSVEVTEIQLSL